MSTRIVFDNGLKLIVTQDKAAVVDALWRDHPEEVTLRGRNGRPLRINWDHVVAIQPLGQPPAPA